jgi:hypothetical protein
MPHRVNVRLARDSLASLRLPSTSIVDGRPAATVVRTCCLRRSGVSTVSISLPVDEATAQRFARSCRREATWQRTGLPVVAVTLAVALVPAIVGIVRHDFGLLLLACLLEWVVTVVTIVIRSMLLQQRSRHHPVLRGRHHVLVRGVDRETAYAWAALNSGAVDTEGLTGQAGIPLCRVGDVGPAWKDA